jgi:hypothetical protein
MYRKEKENVAGNMHAIESQGHQRHVCHSYNYLFIIIIMIPLPLPYISP